MKLLKVLLVAVLGTLLAVGCTVTTTDSTDGGTVADTGAKVDTGSTGTDAGKDTATVVPDAPETCEGCQKSKCATEMAACQDPANTKGCNDLITCVNACKDAACANACITSSSSTAAKAYCQCVIDNCETACSG